MRAILILYMVASVEKGGMGLPDKVAASIYGLYVCGVYLVALPGGWIADRLIGPQRAVLVGGIIIALGHFTLAIPAAQTFFLGLLLVVLGTALLKPAREFDGGAALSGVARDAMRASLVLHGRESRRIHRAAVCGWLGEKVNWHYGLRRRACRDGRRRHQYVLTAKHLGDAGAKRRTRA